MNSHRIATRMAWVVALAAIIGMESAAVCAAEEERKEAVQTQTGTAVPPPDATKAEADKPTTAKAETTKGDAAPADAQKAQAPVRTPEELYKDGQQAIIDGDLIAAMPLFKKSADAGYAPAQVSVGELYVASDFFVESVAYFRKAAEQGNAEGQFGLATSYVEGKGIAKDPRQALEWYTKAAEQNHGPATDALATAYANGGLGLTAEERNSDKALHWIEAAAKHDNLLAMRALAYAYKTGAFGASVNQAQADSWDAKIKEIEAKYQTKKKGKK
jgi:TPR repeat protein